VCPKSLNCDQHWRMILVSGAKETPSSPPALPHRNLDLEEHPG
jgi:hypothetical protein